MRVLLLPSWYIPQGGQFVQHQALALTELGIEVHILANVSLPWTRYGLNEFNFRRFPLHPFFTKEKGIVTLRYFHRPIPKMVVYNIRRWAVITLRLYDLYKSEYGHPDIIHVHSGTWGAYAAALIKKKYGVPYVVTEHRGVFGNKCQLAHSFFHKKFAPFFRTGFSNASALIPVSKQLINKMQTYCTRDVPFYEVGNIVDTDFFTCTHPSRPHQTFRFISVNGFYSVKGYDILLLAWDVLCEMIDNVSLTIVGENFEQVEFQNMLANCRHGNKITFTGELDRNGVREQLTQADAFVMSSRVEAAPVVILEALSMGLPIVGTEVIPEYVLSKEQGIRVPIEDAGALAKAMKQMVKDITLYNAVAQHTHAVKIAHKAKIAQQLINVYKEVVDRAAKI